MAERKDERPKVPDEDDHRDRPEPPRAAPPHRERKESEQPEPSREPGMDGDVFCR